MKKLLAIVLAAFMAAAVFGCTPSEGTTTSSKTQTTAAPDTTTKASQKSSTTTKKAESPKYVIKDQVLIDNELCTVTITGVNEKTIWGFALKILCENKSDKELMFSIDDVSVNGYMVNTLWASDVAPGKKDHSDLDISRSELDEIGIGSVDEIELTFRVYEKDNWGADDFVNDTFTVYPTGLEAKDIVIPERPSDPQEYVVVDNDDCTFIIVKQFDDSIWGYSLLCYCENKTDKLLMFTWDDVSVNDFMITTLFASSIAPGKKEVTSISFSDSQFEENNIDEVSKIEFRLKVYDYNDWLSDKLVDESFTYEVK